MPESVTRTLVAELVSPTAHKERKLEQLFQVYRRALVEAFEAEADTRSAVYDIVDAYELPSQAKSALNQYVTSLCNNGAEELADDHPIRFTNYAATFDHSHFRKYGYCWRVPQPDDEDFWIPLKINPDQRPRWCDLVYGYNEISAGQLQLLRSGVDWELHIIVEYPVSVVTDEAGDPRYIGIDVGEAKLITGCALERGSPTSPFIYDGNRVRQLRKEMHTTLQRLEKRDAAVWRIEKQSTYYQNALEDEVEKASRQVIEYAKQFENPSVVMEDLRGIREGIDYGVFMNRRLHNWQFAWLQKRIVDKAEETGIPVQFVDPEYTSQVCHACKHVGTRPEQAKFRCTNDECWVTEYQADINAAANIARRADPWGESLPWKTERR